MSGVKSNFPKANREIRSNQVRLIDHEGQMMGVVGIREALEMAESKGLDLVEISPGAEPPVCKIMDFGKYKYEAKKRAHDAKKKQKVISVKEMKFKPNIGQGDFNVKVRKIKEFLEEGDKVRISLWFKGREIVHSENGMKIMQKILELVGDIAKVDHEPKIEGKQMLMVLSAVSNTIKQEGQNTSKN